MIKDYKQRNQYYFLRKFFLPDIVCVNIAAIDCIEKKNFNFMSINTERISLKLIYLIKNLNFAKWNLIKNLMT